MSLVSGNVGIGKTSPSSDYKLDGDIDGVVSGTSFNSTSDDRIKHNETEIINALDDINKLKPLKYIKTDKIYEANHDFEIDTSGNPIIDLDEHGLPIKNYIESGFIAQSVLEIDNLNSCAYLKMKMI